MDLYEKKTLRAVLVHEALVVALSILSPVLAFCFPYPFGFMHIGLSFILVGGMMIWSTGAILFWLRHAFNKPHLCRVLHFHGFIWVFIVLVCHLTLSYIYSSNILGLKDSPQYDYYYILIAIVTPAAFWTWEGWRMYLALMLNQKIITE